MNIELITGLILSGAITLFIYNYIGRNFKKLIKILCFVLMPIGILIWIYEIFITHSISFSQVGVIYLLSCLYVIFLAIIGQILEKYIPSKSPRSDPIIFLYVSIFGFIFYAYLYLFEI